MSKKFNISKVRSKINSFMEGVVLDNQYQKKEKRKPSFPLGADPDSISIGRPVGNVANDTIVIGSTATPSVEVGIGAETREDLSQPRTPSVKDMAELERRFGLAGSEPASIGDMIYVADRNELLFWARIGESFGWMAVNGSGGGSSQQLTDDSSPVQEADRTISFSVENKSEKHQFAMLFFAQYQDHYLSNHEIRNELEVDLLETSHNEFRDEIRTNPQRIRGFKMLCDNPQQFGQIWQIEEKKNQRKRGFSMIPSSISSDDPNSGQVNLPYFNMVLNDEGGIRIAMLPKTHVNLIFAIEPLNRSVE